MNTKFTCTALLIFILINFCSCSSDIFYSDFKDFSDGWELSEPVTFELNKTPNSNGNIFINIRNDNNYPFSNIYLISTFLKDGVEVSTDTLEYLMADSSGKYLGKGFGNVKESLLSWKKNINFSRESKYSVVLKHAMRENQNEFGLQNLPGIISVGITLKLSN